MRCVYYCFMQCSEFSLKYGFQRMLAHFICGIGGSLRCNSPHLGEIERSSPSSFRPSVVSLAPTSFRGRILSGQLLARAPSFSLSGIKPGLRKLSGPGTAWLLTPS
ncbi:hypothetical protein AVEN_95115-1 [Araneus ventricosus]|uniref:Uncharacterized protein n=1 Tax=Araneus ventricosus TaxID=182803 RepID=A0A4Y2I8V6_ARAVE|nr:hypothetical protein AVEN_95115-1 [Araneus ventricosus]